MLTVVRTEKRNVEKPLRSASKLVNEKAFRSSGDDFHRMKPLVGLEMRLHSLVISSRMCTLISSARCLCFNINFAAVVHFFLLMLFTIEASSGQHTLATVCEG